MSIPDQFTGYGAATRADGLALNLEPMSYTPQKWTENYVDIKVAYCGICGSDTHVLRDQWPEPTKYKAVVGHEIVGTVVRAGTNSGLKVGDRVGVGAQSGSCLECEYCHKHKEQYCDHGMLGTYQGEWEDGTYAQGGYANYVRVQGRFAVPIPDGLPSDEAAPLLCAGVTTFSPLKRFGAGPGKKVGIVGIGGLGHLAVQWAAAMGAEPFALSQSTSKLADAKKLGVKEENFIVTKDIEATVSKWQRSFDIIICTVSHAPPIESLFFKLLKPEGALVLLGLPEDKIPAMYAQELVFKGITLAGTLIGGTDEIKEMFDLALAKNVRPWITVRPLSEASQAVKDMDNGLPRYRYVLQVPDELEIVKD